MSEVTRHCVIEAPLEEVWAVLADFESISGWADFVDHSSLMTGQSEGVGMQRRIQGRNAVEQMFHHGHRG